MLVQVHGLGVLIEGPPGSGKSALALELLERGHALIADDAVELRPVAGRLAGRCPEVLRGFLEVRGLGTLDVRRAYGPRAVKTSGRIDLVARLRTAPASVRRGPMARRRHHGVELPTVWLPATAGHNRAAMLEAACRMLRTKAEGHAALARRQQNRILRTA